MAMKFFLLFSLFYLVHCNYLLSTNNETATGIDLLLTLDHPGVYGHDVEDVQVKVTYETEKRVRVRIAPNSSQGEKDMFYYELPENYLYERNARTNITNCDYQVRVGSLNNNFSLSVMRKVNSKSVFSLVNLTMALQYLEVSNLLSTTTEPFIYGLGERDLDLRMKFDTPYTIFSLDNAPTDSTSWQYGAHPFYLQVDEMDGTSVGVLLFNPHAMDVTLSSNKYLNYKVVGGVFDFYVILGANPAEVIAEYTRLIGRPYLPPIWSLGFHQCRWGYQNLSVTKEVVEQYTAHGLPLDAIWNDIDYMQHYNDFTLDPFRFNGTDVASFESFLAKQNKHHVYIVDPAIPIANYPVYQNGLKMDVFIHRWNQSSAPLVGKVWPPQPVVFPDFSKPETSNWWKQSIEYFFSKGAQAEGLWIDMNEPSNFCDGEYPNNIRLVTGPVWSENTTSSPDKSLMIQWGIFAENELQRIDKLPVTIGVKIGNPPYLPGFGRISDDYGPLTSLNFHTLSMSSPQYLAKHYSVHSLYGYHEAKATNKALESINSKRAFILSRSTFVGSGNFTSHWTGDNYSNQISMRMSVPHVLSFSLFGIPHVGSDICGFLSNTTEELCTRWMQLGSFYPFSRNHNTFDVIAQEPYAFGANSTVLKASKASLSLRYQILPYLYTLFALASLRGETVARPVFFEYPTDLNTFELDSKTGQFFLGNGLLINPVMDLGVKSINVYLPEDKWFIFMSSKHFNRKETGKYVTLEAPLDTHLPILQRAGSIIPAFSNSSVKLSVKNTYTGGKIELHIASLDFDNAFKNLATGHLYIDSGNSLNPLNFSAPKYLLYSLKLEFAENDKLVICIKKESPFSGISWPSDLLFDTIIIYGLDVHINKVVYNFSSLNFEADDSNKILKIQIRNQIDMNEILNSIYLQLSPQAPSSSYNYTWVYIVSSIAAVILLCGFWYMKSRDESQSLDSAYIEAPSQNLYKPI